MNDGTTTTLAKFFSIQPRKASIADEFKDASPASKSSDSDGADSAEVIEYEDFLKELQADQTDTDEPTTEITTKVDHAPQDDEMVGRDGSDNEQRKNLTRQGDAVTLSNFFTITNKRKRSMDSEEVTDTVEVVSKEKNSEEKEVVDPPKIKKNRHQSNKKRHRSKSRATSNEIDVVAKVDCTEMEVEKTSEGGNQLMETSITEDKHTEQNVSVLSVDDVKKLIDNSLIEAGIIQSPSVAQTPQVISKGNNRTPVQSATDLDSPASSVASLQTSRISLRDVRRRLRDKQEADDKRLPVDTATAPDVRKSERKTRKKKREKVDDAALQGSQAKPIVVDEESADDRTDVISHSTPVKKKRQSKRSITTKDRKKRKVCRESVVSEDEPDVNIVVVKENVDSPRSKLKEERLAKLRAMSSKDDFANLKSSKGSLTPLTQAELFPNIAHITQLPQNEDEYTCQLKFRPRTDDVVINQSSFLDMSIDRVPPLPQLQVTRKKLAKSRVKRELKNLQTLVPNYPVNDVYESLASKASVAEEDQLWTSKYSPSSLSQLLVGQGHVEVINEWLACWKEELVNGKSTFRKKHKKSASKKRAQFINDADSDEADEEMTQTPVLVISGPPGLGKTTCAYTAATLLGYKVFEMNPSMLRTTKTVLERVHESTRSQQVQKGKGVAIDKIFDQISQESTSKPVGGIASFFTRVKDKTKGTDVNTAAKQSGKGKKTDSANSVKEEDGADAVSLSKLSLVLFDEADVSFEEDKGFYEAIKSLGTEAKKPIVLTCQSTNFLRPLGIDYTHVQITPHEESEVAAYLCIVSLLENEVAELDAMQQLVSKFRCDIRKCLLHVQYLVCSGGLGTHPQQSLDKQQRHPQPGVENVHHFSRAYRHRSSLDMISHHHRLVLANGVQALNKLTSNPSKVFVETGGITQLTADLVTWSSVQSLRSTYNELLRETYGMPQRVTSQELLPERALLSIREELPQHMVGISDSALTLDYLPFLRAVCVAENERRASKTSRRFLHHLAKQGLHLTEADQMSAITMLMADQEDS